MELGSRELDYNGSSTKEIQRKPPFLPFLSIGAVISFL